MEVRELGVDHRRGDAARLEQFKALETTVHLPAPQGPEMTSTSRTIETESCTIAEGLARAPGFSSNAICWDAKVACRVCSLDRLPSGA